VDAGFRGELVYVDGTFSETGDGDEEGGVLWGGRGGEGTEVQRVDGQRV
jgi:hypothetical protein